MKRLLIVDDDPDILSSLECILEQRYTVTTAVNGRDALGRLEQAAFDAVVLDMMMPVLDGASLMREMQARGMRVPVVLISAGADLQRSARALAAAAFLAKPFNVDELEGTLERVLGGGGGGGGVARSPASGGGSEPGGSGDAVARGGPRASPAAERRAA